MQQQPQQQINSNVSTALNNENPAAPNSPGSASTTTAGHLSPTNAQNSTSVTTRPQISGGRFDFEDGGTYCGGWDEGKAHGHGVCTGPKHQGAYSGAWNYGFEVSGVYIWPSGSSFEGQWQNGRRHGLGVETRGRWIYRGEWTSGSKGRYGVRQSATSTAKYEGTWASGLQDGYGSETYADGGTYQGQWQEGKRHGYGVRTSAPFGLASHYQPKIQTSMTSLRSNEGGNRNADSADKRNHRIDEVRGGFVLKASSDEPPARRNSLVEKTRKGLLSGLKLKKQKSTGDLEKRGHGTSSIRSTISNASWISTGSSQSAISNKSVHTDSNASFTVDEEHLDPSVTEVYMGDWKRDKRDGYGISERSDGLKYEGEWHNNKKHGYGVTTFRDGTKEEGKYKYNVLITSQKKKHLFLIRSAKFRERIDAAVSSSQRASKYALQKADIAVSRTATARSKAESADTVAELARVDSEIAVATAREFAPDFKPSVLDRFERIRARGNHHYRADLPPPHLHAKLPLVQQTSLNATPNHMPLDRTQASSDSTPQKQISFPQTSQRRTSLQKQVSVDYPSIHPGPSPQNQFPTNSMNQAQMPSAQYQQHQQAHLNQNQYNGGNQNPNSYGPNQNYQMNANAQQHYNNSNYMGNSAAAAATAAQQYGHTQYGQQLQPQIQTQYSQQQIQNQYSVNQPAYTNYNNLGNQNDAGYSQDPEYLRSKMGFGPQNSGIQPNFNQQQQMQNSAVGMNSQLPLENSIQYQKQTDISQSEGPGPSNLRRNSRQVNESSRPTLGSTFSQSSIDHFDHYKRPPSRDSSVDRYSRALAAGRQSGSRQASIDRSILQPNIPNTVQQPDTAAMDRSTRAGSAFRNMTSVAMSPAAPNSQCVGNGSVATGTGRATARASMQGSGGQALYSSPNQPFEDVLLRQRTLGQDIIPSPREPKRTESLYTPQKPTPAGANASAAAGNRSGKLKSIPIALPLSRKKSLPDVQELPRATNAMGREEVSALGSARREEIRRQTELSERLKANPLLYLVSPQMKDWFSHQQLVLVVLVANIALALLFFKVLTS